MISLFILAVFANPTTSSQNSAPQASSIQSPGSGGSTTSVEELFQKRSYQKVIERLAPRLVQLPRTEVIILGNSYSGLRNHAAALKTFNSLAGKSNQDPEVLTLIGREHFLMGQNTEALNSLRAAMEQKTQFEAAYHWTARVYEKLNNNYELRILYQDMIEKFGERPQFVQQVCRFSTLEGLNDLAETSCRRAIELQPKEASAHVNLGTALKQKGELEKAERYLRQAANSFPQSALAQIAYARHFEEKKNPIQAYEQYKKATQADPTSVQAWVGVGQAAVEVQKYPEALNAFRKACRISPQSVAHLRKASSILRTAGASKVLPQFEDLIDHCR